MRAQVPYIDRIWRVKSSLELEEPLSAYEAFDRLGSLLGTQGTEVTVEGDTLTYVKTNPAAQDKLATFTAGTLKVDGDENARTLSWDVTSTALFLCFLAPLGFIAFGQFAAFINELEKPALIAEMAEKEKEKEKEKEEAKKIELHWIDQLLGAPEPKQPGEEDEEEAEKGRGEEGRGEEGREDEEPEGNHSPMTAYVFAGIFFAIYLVGRVLEPYLLKRTFRAALRQPDDAQLNQINEEKEAGAKLAPQGGGVHET